MKSLEQQYLDPDITTFGVLINICQHFEIEERGGGPEGIYYTHPKVDGEYLLRNLTILIGKVEAQRYIDTKQND